MTLHTASARPAVVSLAGAAGPVVTRSAAATTPPAAMAPAAGETTLGMHPTRHLLLGLDQQVDQVPQKPSVLIGVKRRCAANVADAACAPDAMNVLLNVVREIVIDHMSHIRDVQATRSNSCGNKDGSAS